MVDLNKGVWVKQDIVAYNIAGFVSHRLGKPQVKRYLGMHRGKFNQNIFEQGVAYQTG